MKWSELWFMMKVIWTVMVGLFVVTCLVVGIRLQSRNDREARANMHTRKLP